MLLVAPHPLAGGAGAHGGPGTVVLVVQCAGGEAVGLRHAGVASQKLSLAHRLNPQNVHIGAFGHAHIAVTPAVSVDVVHHLLSTIPIGLDGPIGLHHTVFGALDHRVGIVELEQGQVAGVLEHRRALGIVEAGEVEVGGFVAVIGARSGGT